MVRMNFSAILDYHLGQHFLAWCLRSKRRESMSLLPPLVW